MDADFSSLAHNAHLLRRVKFNGKDSFNDLNSLILKGSEAGVPSAKIFEESLPFSSGVVDFSKLGGSLQYNRRQLRYNFLVAGDTPEEAREKADSIVKWLYSNGDNEWMDTLENTWEDPAYGSVYVYTNVVCSEVEMTHEMRGNVYFITISALLLADPYRRKQNKRLEKIADFETNTSDEQRGYLKAYVVKLSMFFKAEHWETFYKSEVINPDSDDEDERENVTKISSKQVRFNFYINSEINANYPLAFSLFNLPNTDNIISITRVDDHESHVSDMTMVDTTSGYFHAQTYSPYDMVSLLVTYGSDIPDDYLNNSIYIEYGKAAFFDFDINANGTVNTGLFYFFKQFSIGGGNIVVIGQGTQQYEISEHFAIPGKKRTNIRIDFTTNSTGYYELWFDNGEEKL